MAHNIDHVLGKSVPYRFSYNPEVLAREPRISNREIYGFTNDSLPFSVGFDVWHAYECTFLTVRGLPINGILKLVIPADSEFIVESKSLKLYLFSFNMQKLGDNRESAIHRFCETVQNDISALITKPIAVGFFPETPLFVEDPKLSEMEPLAHHIDLDTIDFTAFHENETILQNGSVTRPIAVKSDLLRSNCKITNQPDFGTLFIGMSDTAITFESLAQYIVSFRGENHFHEEIVECIFERLNRLFSPNELLVTALYTRRGGIDICPVRASEESLLPRNLIDPKLLTVKEYRS